MTKNFDQIKHNSIAKSVLCKAVLYKAYVQNFQREIPILSLY